MPSAPTYQLLPRVYPDREALGAAAARDIGDALARRLASQPGARVIFASAPSQEATLRHLAKHPGIDWARVTAFHMDEYLGLAPDAPQRFGTWLRRTLFDHVPVGTVHLIEPGHPIRLEAGPVRPGRGPAGRRGPVRRAARRGPDRPGLPGHRGQRAHRVQRPARRLQ